MPLLDKQVSVSGALHAAAELTVFQTDVERTADSGLTVPDAARFLGVPAADVWRLVEGGAVPLLSAGGGATVAYHDVAAIALNSGLGTSVPELGLAMMMRFARQSADALLRDQDWSFVLESTELPETGAVLGFPDDGGRIVSVPGTESVPGGWRVGSGGATTASVAGALTTRGVRRPLRSVAVNSLFDETVDDIVSGRIRFQWISATGRRDPQSRWREGRIDCVALAFVLQDELRRIGVQTRIESGRVLGLLDARHTWVGVLEDDVWKRFDPLLSAHCHRLWGPNQTYGEYFRGSIPNALIGWPGPHGALFAATGGVEHTFVARRVVS